MNLSPSGFDYIPFLNPLYVIPIIAVLVCAFLVYAFGFKTPVQPPNFDDIEGDKKAPSSKKRKSKENHKSKHSNNGKNSSSSKNSESLKEKKQKEKAPAQKSEPKVVKKPVVIAEKKKLSIQKEPEPIMEEYNEEGWVHQVSKKGRKNRKKDDGTSNATLPPIVGHAETKPISQTSVNQDDTRAEVKRALETSSAEEDVSDKSPLKETPVSPPKPSKQKNKKKNNEEVSHLNDVAETKEKKQEANIQLQTNAAAPTANGVEVSVSAKEKKPAKKKKKKVEANEEESNLPEAALMGTIINSETTSSTTAGLPKTSAEKSIGKTVKTEAVNDTKAAINEEAKNTTNDEPIVAKGTNVAFDEMEGLYPVSKPQKKKKKVRREH